MTGVDSTSLTLRDAGNQAIPAGVSYSAVERRATLTPLSPLRPAAQYRIVLSSAIHDQAGNPLSTTSSSFATGVTLYGLPGWPAYARSTLAEAQAYAYRILRARYVGQWRTGPPRWGRTSWPNDYRSASYANAAAYSLRILIAEARARGVAV